MQFGLPLNIQNFFYILEHYNPNTNTFFMPVREMGMAMHEMHEVTLLPDGDYPYEEFVPNKRELRELEKQVAVMFDVY